MSYNFSAEIWSEFSIAMSFILLRFFARLKVLGLGSFGLEDVLMGAVLVLFTVLTTLIHFTDKLGTNIGLNAETAPLVPQEARPSMVIGSKIAFFNWMIYVALMWTLKATFLTLYTRMYAGLPLYINIIRGVCVLTALTFLAAELGHILQCRPAERNWQIDPYPGDECTLRNLNYYNIGILNITTDLIIIAVPLPMIFKVRMPIWRKIVLALLLCSGIFIVIASILRTYYSLLNITLLPIAMGWASRETFVAIIAVSIPGIKPLFHKTGWFRSEKASGDQPRSGYTGGGGTSGPGWTNPLRSGPQQGQFELSSKSTWRVAAGTERLSSGDSEEHIIGPELRGDGKDSPKGSGRKGGEIQVTQEFTLVEYEDDRPPKSSL